MARADNCIYPESRPLLKTLEDISQTSGVSRAQAFENSIQAIVCAGAAETMEEEYFEAIKDHTKGPKGERGVDLIAKFMGQTIDAMSKTDRDVLGDLFQGSISYGENGLFLTPEEICTMLSQMTASCKGRSLTPPPTAIPSVPSSPHRTFRPMRKAGGQRRCSY